MDWGRIGKAAATGGLTELGNFVSDYTKNKYAADENSYTPQIDAAAANNLALQKMLLAQANGGGPNLAAQQFLNAQQALAGQAAGQIGSIKGISPAAQARLLANQTASIGQNIAGEAAAQRMQQQLAAQQLLGQQSLGMYDVATGRRIGAQGINAGVAAGNAATNKAILGGVANGIGAAMGMGVGAPAAGGAGAGVLGSAGGEGLLSSNPLSPGRLTPPTFAAGGVVPGDGCQSEVTRMLAAGARPMTVGGPVPGSAPVPGDSLRNDTVPAVLSPGEIVIPRSHAHSPEAAASFVAALQRRNGGGYADVLAARAAAGGR